MLFINFVCLLYLMVLIDSHTISKSIDNDAKVDDIFDSINNLDHTRNPKLRRNRYLQKYRVDYRDEFVRPETFKETKLFSEAERTTEQTTEKTTLKSTTEHAKHHKSPKRRVGNFWRKFRGKDKKNKQSSTNQRKRRIPKNREYASKYPSTKDSQNSGPSNKNRRKNRNQFTLRQPELNFAKRDLSRSVLYSTRTPNTPRTNYKLEIGISPQIDDTLKHKHRIKPVEPERLLSDTNENLTGQLATMTTQISQLKQMYGLERYNPHGFTVSSSYEKAETVTPPTTPTEPDFEGTAQIEELLNDIKIKAIQMISEQNPLVTDIISNSVTEATFEADPILTHIDMAAPGYFLSTIVSINDIANPNEKRTVSFKGNEFYLNDSILITNTESHYLAARSIKEEAMTIAHNVEDMLQRELKMIYNKVKHKVSSDFRKEMHKAKSTMKEGISKISSKATTCKTKTTTSNTTTKPKTCKCKDVAMKEKNKEKVKEAATTASRLTREGKFNKHNPETPESANPTPTYDDYAMLTLYEQMLAKTHEDNVRKLLATTDLPFNKKRREHFRLSKRNPETLTDVKLREVIQKLYDDGVTMPDYDYIDPTANVSSTGASTSVENPADVDIDPTGTIGSSSTGTMIDSTDKTQIKATTSTPTVTESDLEDTSFEGLINKISYNDFVNGYKHYLKFQKEQNNQNFSNLIKYQAHRHHSVDDIGKFILNKIPPLPSKRLKRFFDDSDIQYQEITTKSDDSWFRKHFYLFIDNGPPKKFHTSQTVELKSAVTEPDTKIFITEPMPRSGSKDQVYIRIGSDDTTRYSKDASEISLDDLTKILDSIKNKQSASPFFRGKSKSQNEKYMPPGTPFNSTDETVIQIKMLPHNFIEKLFGNKRRQAPKNVQRTIEYFPAVDMITEIPQGRYKRTVTKEDQENTVMDDFINKDVKEKASTGAKEVIADPTRSSIRETNKYGYVDIDLVPRQTEIVKLRENSKKSRFKNFFKKFNFKRNKAKKKHAKRSYYYNNNLTARRRMRFNPIEKLKDIFRVKPEDKDDSPVFRLPNMPDYDMMTSHIETFKPIKYDKPMTIDEMKKQIPNISDIVNDSLMPKRTTKLTSYVFRLDENDRNLLSNYGLPTTAATKQFSQQIGKQTSTTEATTTIRPKSTVKAGKQKIPPSNVITVNVKTLKPMTTPTTTTQTESTPLMTLDDINFILNKIQHKLQKSSRNFTGITTPYYKRGTMVHRENALPIHREGPLEELTIKSKLTRIAKFPISKRHFRIGRDDAQPIHIGNDYLSFHDGPLIKEYIHELRNRNVAQEKKKTAKGTNMRKFARTNIPRLHNSEKCRYTDYFNDLLMWHNDILNLDKVPSPIWKNILKNIQSESGQTYTTPNMNNLLMELNEINEFLGKGTMKNRLMVTSNNTINVGPIPRVAYAGIRSIPDLNDNKQGVIRSMAMDDNTLVTSKDMIIKGEAKYYQYNKPKTVDSQLKSNEYITKLNRMNVYDNDYKGIVKGKGGYRRSKSPPFDNKEPAILVDTTLMAYDDEAESVTKSLEVKKLSRNSQKSSKAAVKHGQMHSFLKTNKAPKQYFTTPLPMKAFEFNKFLKEHKMDVESVTSPILELPTLIENWNKDTTEHTFTDTTERTTSLTANAKVKTKKVENTTQKLTKLESLKSMTDALDKSIKYTNKLVFKSSPAVHSKESNKKNTFLDDFDRYKRYSELNKLPSIGSIKSNKDTTPEFNYYSMLKKKMKDRLFEKKASAAAERPTTDLFTLDPHNKEVEITIINFEDIDKMTTPRLHDEPYESYTIPSIRQEENAPFPDFTDRQEATNDRLSKPEDFIHKEEMHNGLLYKDIFKEQTASTTMKYTPPDFTKSTEYVDPIVNEAPSVTVNKLRPFDKIPQMYPNVLGKISHAKNFNVPKRVHISSHHYKYDIFYDDNKKIVKAGFEGVRPKQSLDSAMAPNGMRQQTHVRIPTRCKPKPGGGLSAPGEELETPPHQSAQDTTARVSTQHADSISGIRASTASSSASTAELRAQQASLVYDLKHLRRPTSSDAEKKDTDRHRRLYKISALIQDRFKSLMKNLTTTKHSESTKQTPKSNSKCTCNCTCKMSTEKTKVPDEEEETEVDKEDLEDDGFRITCGPNKGPRAYYEIGPLERPPPTPHTSTTQSADEPYYFGKHNDIKRDVQTQNTFTAKDVAALEVIVDLMKNTLSYEEKDIASVFHNNNFAPQPHATKSVNRNDSSNSIQVHIAIPFDFQNGKKRSPLDPVRVRKVFSAKMSTPVDLEYQVHSFEGTVAPTSSTVSSRSSEDGLSPGMYLLVDKPRNGYALKPVKTKINMSRQVAVDTTASMSEAKLTETRDETTSLKSLGKVTLSKDFISAVNKQLVEMYENMSMVNKEVTNNTRTVRSIWKSHKLKDGKEGKKSCAEKYTSKRRIDWEAVKKYFGHDRVCNCKCRTNKTMCRACAASDAVIDELIFEFDNIGRYMKDHCTEIQTFFWMNPGGGQKLRESVSRIDKSLGDYYKRVKGKCQGRTCKTFTTYIDKRQIVKTSKVPKQDVWTHLINDLSNIAEDLNRTISLKTCFNDKLKEEGEKFIYAINSCLSKKSFDKRSNEITTQKKLIKNVYSLDNINVNIICNPEVSSNTDEYALSTAPLTHEDATSQFNDQIFDYDMGETKANKRKGFKKLFPRKSKKRKKMFTYFVSDFSKQPKTHFKRDVDNCEVTPLISDGGGAFWWDYIKTGTNEPRLARDSLLKDKPNIEIAVVQKGVDGAPKIQEITEKSSSKNAINSIYMTVRTTPMRKHQRETETTTDYLTHNINQLLQLFGSLQDVESMNMHSNRSTMFLNHPTTQKEAIKNKSKTKKSTKCVKKVKTKMHYKGDKKEKTTAMSNATTSSTTTKATDTKIDDITGTDPLESMEPKVTGKSNSSTSMLPTTKNQMNPNETIIIRDTTRMQSETISTTAGTTKSLAKTNKDTKKTSVTPKKDSSDNTDSKSLFDDEPLTHQTTTSSFLGKLKTATLRFIDNFGKSPKDSTEAPSTTQANLGLSSNIEKISSTEIKMADFEESSRKTTHMSPTIVIINEYDDQISNDILNDPISNAEGYRNLLLSIIQFETNKLNDEWHRIAYGGDGDRDESDIKRSIIDFSKIDTTKPASKAKPKTNTPEDEYDVFQGFQALKNLELPDPGSKTKKPEGLLNKIVSKMGIKVVSGSKKKAVKKLTLREVTQKKKKNRKRKLRVQNWRLENPTEPGTDKKACDSRRASESSQICDIQATFEHIKDLQKTLPAEEFENLVKNVSCYKYKNVDSKFFIRYKRKGKRWDWIRNKRSLKLHFSRGKDESDFDDKIDVVNFDDDLSDSFERFVKGDDGIYKIVQREKRTVSLDTLDLGLRNMPNLTPGENEVYIMVGDSVTLDCVPYTPVPKADGNFIWRTDRKLMLEQDNVDVDGAKVTIHNVEPRNIGSYTCSLDNTVQRNVRLSVMTIPAFDVVFLPIYKTEEICSYDDLKAIQRLGALMAEETNCGKACSMRIDEPVCQRDRGTNSSLIRTTAVISVTPRLNCSLQCRRDVVSSLVMFCASNTAVLSSIGVVMSKDGVNETLTPWKQLGRPVVTHTLRKKDTNGHREYHKLVATLTPGKVDVVLNCPAGYYLLPEYKLCSSCPADTQAARGANACAACPRGARAPPGAARCRAAARPRRYDWWWYPPCGYVVACCGVMCGCTACALLSLIVHVVSRDVQLQDQKGDDVGDVTRKTASVTVAYARTPHHRPLSPSRVILARFFKPSLTSSRATDSQETKFELWKERNIPPPLPPIDFEF